MKIEKEMLLASRVTYLLLLVFCPLAFGCVEDWAFFVMTLLLGVSMALFLAHKLLRGQRPLRVPCLVPLALIGLYILFQATPLPGSLLSVISPSAAALRRQTTAVLSPGALCPLTLDLHGTVFELCRWLAWAGFYWLTVQLLSDRKMLRFTLLFVTLFGSLFALSSILQYILTEDRALWFRTVRTHAIVFGSYVCHNHYAGLMEMIIGPAVAVLLLYRPPKQFGTFRERVLGFFQERETPLFILLCTGTVVMVLSIFFSLSRGGIMSLFAAMILMAALAAGKDPSRRRVSARTSAWILLIGITMALTWFGWEKLDVRFGKLQRDILSEYGRLQFWRDSLKAAGDFPITGAGFGAFRAVITAYQQTFTGLILDHAHNDYLELLVEGGAAGVLLIAAFLACFLVTIRKTLSKRHDHKAVLLCAGALSGMAAIMFHSAVDFNLHIPANAMYMAFLIGLAVSAANIRLQGRSGRDTHLDSTGAGSLKAGLVVWLALWVPVACIAAGRFAATLYAGDLAESGIAVNTPFDLLEKEATAAERAARLDPWHAGYRAAVGDAAVLCGKGRKAIDAYAEALLLSPVDSRLLQRAGNALFQVSRDAQRAEALMRAGIEVYPKRPGAYFHFADFLFRSGRKEDALRAVRQGLAATPGYARTFFELMRYHGLTPAEIYAILPMDPVVLAKFAHYVRNTDYGFMREGILLKAVEAAEKGADIQADPYVSLAWIYIGRRDYAGAVTLLEKGLQRLPDQPELLYLMGLAYERDGIYYKALECYKRLELVSPGYRDTKRRIDALGGAAGG